ncbi:hypothetical protein AMTR_s00057p00130160 [Amborella trichopoda]|uniref:Uncharacterized protein n=1 Tax=Amborella trichopoda TaxID=13333 RepID=U5CU68_AMBTC|nr:hypothetical protein AMTR_s00057p00130160 [Amborella trichopoda]
MHHLEDHTESRDRTHRTTGTQNHTNKNNNKLTTDTKDTQTVPEVPLHIETGVFDRNNIMNKAVHIRFDFGNSHFKDIHCFGRRNTCSY